MTYAAFKGVSEDERPQSRALLTLETSVADLWIDYNGHMTEWQYYQIMADAGENFLRAAGFTEEYRLKGFSLFSVEGHMRNLKECRVGTPLKIYTDMIGFDDIRLHIYQYVVDASRDLTLATCEHMMIHVDTNLRKRTPMLPYLTERMEDALRKWAPALQPKGLGASIRTYEVQAVI